jgi:hypothetical protein
MTSVPDTGINRTTNSATSSGLVPVQPDDQVAVRRSGQCQVRRVCREEFPVRPIPVFNWVVPSCLPHLATGSTPA